MNSKGMTLIEVMIGMSLAIGVGLTVMKVTQTGQKGMAKLSTDSDLNLWRNGTLLTELSNQDTCSLNFNSLDMVNDTSRVFPTLLKGQRTATYPAVAALSATSLFADLPTWQPTRIELFSPQPLGSTSGTCRLEITLDRMRSSLGTANRKVIIPLDCSKQAAGDNLEICSMTTPSGGGGGVSQWILSGNDFIYYDGRALVGPDSPNIPTAGFTIDTVIPGTTAGRGLEIRNRDLRMTDGAGSAVLRNVSDCFTIGDTQIGHSLCPRTAGIAVDYSNNPSFGAGSQNSAAIAWSHTSASVTIVNGNNSVVMGDSSTISGNNSFSLGQQNLITSDNSFVLGSQSSVSAERSMVLGTGYTVNNNDKLGALFIGGYDFSINSTTNDGLYVYSNGASPRVDIGSLRPVASSSTAYVAGSMEVAGNLTALNYFHSSDKRLKEDILPLTGALEKIRALKPVSFNWKKNHKSDIGFIAQELELIFPQLVKTGPDSMKSVNYSALTSVLSQAVTELEAKNSHLEKKLELVLDLLCEKQSDSKLCLVE